MEINLKYYVQITIAWRKGSIEPVGRPYNRERLDDSPVSVNCHRHQHVVGGGEGVGLQKLEHLAENLASQPLSV